MTRPPEFPRVGALLKSGTGVAVDNAGLLLGLWAVCGLPPQILGLAVGFTTGVRDADAFQRAFDAQDWSVMGPMAVVGAVSMIFGLIGYAAVLLMTARAHGGRKAELGEALIAGVGRMLPLIGASLLTALAVLTGTLALIVPGLILMVRLSLSACAAVADDMGPVRAVSRSWALTRGRFWSVSTALSAFVGLAFLAAVALLIFGKILGAALSPMAELGEAFAKIVVNAGQFLISAWVTACLTKLYWALAKPAIS